MASVSSRPPTARPVAGAGALLRQWRRARRLSQLELSLRAGVSSRHLSYVETGRSRASPDMVLRLADALTIPLRERNSLLVAAGFAPRYFETGLDAEWMAPVRSAIELILRHQEPYPAFVLDRHWNIRMSNQAAQRCTRYLLDAEPVEANMVRRLLRPDGLRPVIVNWEEMAGDLIRHLHDQAGAMPSDIGAAELLAEVLAYPDVPEKWREQEVGVSPTPVLTIVFRKDDTELRFFSTLTTFATPRDVALEDLRIECVFPADEATRAACRRLFAISE